MTRSVRALAFGAMCVAALAAAVACTDSEEAPAPGAASPDAIASDAGSPDLDSALGTVPDVISDYDASNEAVVCDATPCVVALTAGAAHACALLADGTVSCWGDDTKGALGRGEQDAAASRPGAMPSGVAGVGGVVEISAADRVACATLGDGGLRCWGANDRGQLGLSANEAIADDDPHPTAAAVDLLGPIERVEVGHGSACARLRSGSLTCWGANDRNQLLRERDAGAVEIPAPPHLDAGVELSRIAFGDLTAYGITADRSLLSWGAVSGRLSSLTFDPEPQVLPTLAGVVDVAASALDNPFEPTLHICAIAKGVVYCWGKTAQDEVPALCNGVPNDQSVPVPAPTRGTAFPQRLAVSRSTTCVRLTDGTIECCGDDSKGQLGRGTIASNPVALAFGPVTALTEPAVQVVTMDEATCALTKGGRVACWGGNRHGELGQGNVDSAAHPAAVMVGFQ